MTLTVKDVGEQGLLPILQKYCPGDIIGDDGAILSLPEGYSLVVSTDILVNNVHFSDRTTSPEDVGWRAAAANLSDLAAMGAQPLGITVGLALTPDLSLDWLERLYQSLTACLQVYQTAIVGGDVCRAREINISITALGKVAKNQEIKRSNARVGNSIVITGYHGLSRAGLELLFHPETGKACQDASKNRLIQAHQRPRPRLDCIPYLEKIVKQFAIAGMDSSDGLADAIIQICRCSGVGAVIERIPLDAALLDYVGTQKARKWALYGGEDFELVLCLPNEQAQELIEQIGEGAAIIGQIVSEKGVRLADGEELTLGAGFQHF